MYLFPSEENQTLYTDYLIYIFGAMLIETLLKYWIHLGLFWTYLFLTISIGLALFTKKGKIFGLSIILTAPCILMEAFYIFVLFQKVSGLSLVFNILFVIFCIVFLVYIAFICGWLYKFYKEAKSQERIDDEPYMFRQSSIAEDVECSGFDIAGLK